jgi:hypothetical protein
VFSWSAVASALSTRPCTFARPVTSKRNSVEHKRQVIVVGCKQNSNINVKKKKKKKEKKKKKV